MTTAKEGRDALLAIVAAIWAAVAISIPAAQMINERKDAVISGFIGDHRISIPHREAIMKYDWPGYVGCNAIVGFLFAYLLFLITRKLETDFKWFGRICAVAALGYSVAWLCTASRDRPVMEAAIAAAKAEVPAGYIVESVSDSRGSLSPTGVKR